MRARHAVLPTRSVSSRPTHLRTSSQSAYETPQIPFFVFKRLRTLLTIQRRMVILRNAVTKDPPALAAHYLPAKSFGMCSYQNSQVWPNSSRFGTRRSALIPLQLIQVLSFQTLVHSFAQWALHNSFAFKRFRTFSIATGVWGVPLCLYFAARTFVRCLSTFNS